MRRSTFASNTEETRIYSPTVPELAVAALRNRDYENGLRYVTKAVEDEGWQVRFHDEPGDGTASFSRKDGKIIDVYKQDARSSPISSRHLIASLVHEYLYGELANEAENSATPREYMKAHFKEFAELDVEVAGSIDYNAEMSHTGVGVLSHRRHNLKLELTEQEITRLLEK